MQAIIPRNHMSFSMGKEGADSLGKALAGSGFLHLMVVILLSVGLPMVKREEMTITNPVSVEIVDIAEITQTDRVAVQTNKPRPDKDKPPEETPQAKLTPPPMTADAPPDLSVPAPPDIADTPKEAADVPPPEPLKRKELKAPPPMKKPVSPAQKKQEKATSDFITLLKNLTPDLSESQGEAKSKDASAEDSAPLAQLSQKLTVSEEEALRRQLAQCWNVLSGAKYAENLVIEVRVVVNPDRTVQRATIVDQGRYTRDPHFRAAAEAALRALRNPKCTPLALPPEKYENWKNTVIRFDPRSML